MELEVIKKLREKTGAGIQLCQQSLQEANGDITKAIEILRKKGKKIVDQKQLRQTKEGVIESYIHVNRKIGAMIQLVCETDFVSRSDDFRNLAHNLAMQIAATNPQWISPQDVPQDVIKKEKKIYLTTIPKDKPEKMKEKIVEGKLEKFYSQNCLIKQPFIKDDKITIEKLINEYIVKLKENIKIKNFIRFSL